MLIPVVLIAGCVAGQADPNPVGESATSGVQTLRLEYDLSASETQNQLGGFGLGIEEPDCVSIQGDPIGTVRHANATVTWEATTPSHQELHLEFLSDPRFSERISTEGASPLTLAFVGPLDIADDDGMHHVFQAYVGAPRGTSLVAKQPFHLELTLEILGEVRDYPSACTVAG